MKRFVKLFLKMTFSAVFSLWAVGLQAQELDTLELETFIPEGYELVDSLVYTYSAPQDSLLQGKDILQIMPARFSGGKANVEIRQSQGVTNSLYRHIYDNSKRAISGYRVRIYSDNRQSSRAEADQMLIEFQQKYRDIKAYKTYVNPYFKVTVGDCRTRSEAMALLERIIKDFPSAFIVKESINYPVIDPENAYEIDTIKVLKPIHVEQ